MDVSEAVAGRISVRAYRPDPVPEATVREILDLARKAPSGGNLQPWRVWALAGDDLEALKTKVRARLAEAPTGEPVEYDVYPKGLWEPFRSRRFQCGEDLYATIGVTREDRFGRMAHVMRNFEFWGAPVGLFFLIDRRLGPPQWADLGMFMQTVMLLATERGLSTCAQEAWAIWPRTVSEHLGAPEDLMLFAGMALGYADEAAPINALRTRRDPLEEVAEFRGFSD